MLAQLAQEKRAAEERWADVKPQAQGIFDRIARLRGDNDAISKEELVLAHDGAASFPGPEALTLPRPQGISNCSRSSTPTPTARSR